MKKMSKLLALIMLVVMVAVAAVGCTFISTERKSGNSTNITVEKQSVVFNTVSEDERTLMSLQEAYRKVYRTSVAIEVVSETVAGAGSGVIIDMNYENETNENIIYIITCHHVIEDGGDVYVYLPDENCRYDNEDYAFTGKIGGEITDEYAVSLIGGDKNTDIAILKLDLSKRAVSGNKLSADKIVKANVPAEGYDLSVAEEVFAVGNPTGTLPGSFSAGYVSYLDRVATVEDIGAMTLLQIAVPINPGNSGGGLYNLYGELVGITNAGNTDYEQVNYAIPFETIYNETDTGYVRIAEELLGTYTGSNYGFVAGNKEQYGFTVAQGEDNSGKYVYVAAVTEGSQAYTAGLKVNDIVTSVIVNGGETAISEVSQMTEKITSLNIGDSITIKGTRTKTVAGFPPRYETESFSVTLEARQFLFCDTGIYEGAE